MFAKTAICLSLADEEYISIAAPSGRVEPVGANLSGALVWKLLLSIAAFAEPPRTTCPAK